MIFAREYCDHDEVIGYGASEAGKNYGGAGATKRLEGFLRLPKCLEDVLDNIPSKVDDLQNCKHLGLFTLAYSHILLSPIAPLNIPQE
jgi:hypothetical protein